MEEVGACDEACDSSLPCSYLRRENRTGGRLRENCRKIGGNFKCCLQQKEEEKVAESCITAVLKFADHQYGEDSRVHPCLCNGNGNVLKDALLL